MNDADKASAFRQLHTLGVGRVVIDFSGGNDEGSADNHLFFGPDDLSLTCSLSDELMETLEAPIYDTFGGFDGWVDISGTLTWDVTAGTVKLEHSATEWVEQPAINF